MAKVVKHAWTHRPRAQGGTDPLDIEIPGGIVSHFPRHPVITSHTSGGYTEWPGGVVVIEAALFATAGTPTTDATSNYSGQDFLRFTTANASYAAASNLVVVNPEQINLLDNHAYQILFQYRLDATATGVRLGWMHAGDTPAEVVSLLPASSPSNDWFSIGLMATTVGVAKVRHGTPIEIRAYKTSGNVGIDLDLIMFVPNDYQEGSPALGGDPGTNDTYRRVPETGQLSATSTLEFPDLTHYNGQCLSDTQVVNSILDPAFRWSTTTWSNGFQPFPQSSGEVDSFAWEAGHGRHFYVTARAEGGTVPFAAGALVAYGSNGMPHASSVLFNNSWQLVYLGPSSPSHEIGHLAGCVLQADPGGNEAPFDSSDYPDEVRVGTTFEVSCLYDPQGT